MTRDAPAGFVTGLLRRVSGQAQGVTPRTPSYFAGEAAADVPEVTEFAPPNPTEQAEPPKAPAPRLPASAPEPSEITAHAPQRDQDDGATQAPETRLFDPAPAPSPPAPVSHVQPVEAAEAAPAAQSVEADPAAPRRAEPEMARRDQPAAPAATPKQAPPSHSDFPKLPNVAAEVAAAIASLRGNEAPEAEARVMPVADAPASIDLPQPPPRSEPDQRAETEPPQPQPMHIHIGEIVIAPDTPTATTPHAPTQSAPWTPNLTLDAYREARRKGAR